ncbi:hypothetical protein PF005_g19365 [Phytophthora fragariae]|uniref:Uncharacterized protein n=1 Tax=Phytophthora fragariae TaxID=53985 RepID=A0A6A3XGL1_9STRA|nr:hypothetical protein PF011_g14507 [Phytophthora fragariae]KAE9190165.1 hypothetical protein PF005_g19365 [Phytophthora fragariae]KAE9202303.1 hypothetical protein PF002_g21288 [Phytophthora fragariae]KAE9216036.1 hypothetical protein PF004_g14572 [Phytophthora fragariae]
MRHFQLFGKTNGYGKRIIDACDEELFRGLEIGAHVIGRPDLITDEVVKRFLADQPRSPPGMYLKAVREATSSASCSAM